MECVAILFDEKTDWDNIKKLMADINFLARMKNLNVQKIPDQIFKTIKAKVDSNPNFKPKEIKAINFAAKSICEWVKFKFFRN